MVVEYPLREKKKQATRDAITTAAQLLFAEKGYEATTLENIAAKADLHLQTLYRHFESKSALAVSIDRDSFNRFELSFVERDVPTVVFWRQWIEQYCQDVLKNDKQYRQNVTTLFSEPSLQTAILDTWFQYQKLLATGLAKDMKVSVEDPRPCLVAATLWGGQLYVLRRWIDSGGRRDFTRDCLEVVDTTVENWGHVIDP